MNNEVAHLSPGNEGPDHAGDPVPVAPPPPPPEAPRLSDAEESRGILWAEVAVVLTLAVLPDIYFAFDSYFETSPAPSSTWDVSNWLFVRSAQVSAPLLFILWLRRVDWKRFGFRRFRLLIDLPLTALVTLIAWGSWYGLWYALAYTAWAAGDDTVFGLNDPSLNPEPEELSYYANTFGGWTALTLANLANGFAEEFVMRAYLITRLTTLMNSWVAALVLSTALFALYHCYQGPIGVVSAGMTGLLFGGVFLLTRRLWPIALAHAATNLVIAAGY